VGTTINVMDCAGKVLVRVLVVEPFGGGVTVRFACGTIAAGLALL
jgi:hypothetical protein